MFKENPERAQHYPEHIAQVHNGSLPALFPACIRSFVTGKCSNNHYFAKQLHCGKEYCPHCGKEGSEAHNRRISRWWPKVMSMQKVGYLVITIPEQARESFKDVSLLKAFKLYVKRKLQRMGYNKGLISYHWYGSCKHCTDKDGNSIGCDLCYHTGAGVDWNPHLNVLLESGYMKPEKLDAFTNEIKTDVLTWIERNTAIDCNGKKNVYYNYCNSDKKKVHRMKYILRSTFRLYNREIAELLKGFRNRTTWGTFDKIEFPESEGTIREINSLEKKICPCCGAKVSWKDKIKRTEFKMSRKLIIGAGYYQLVPDG